MTRMIVRFERSDAFMKVLPEGTPQTLTVEHDMPEGPWVQITRSAIRSQDGASLYVIDDELIYSDGDDEIGWTDAIIEFKEHA